MWITYNVYVYLFITVSIQDLIEIFVTRSNEQLKLINKAYKQKYKESLEKALVGDTSGDFKRLMVSLNNVSCILFFVEPDLRVFHTSPGLSKIYISLLV